MDAERPNLEQVSGPPEPPQRELSGLSSLKLPWIYAVVGLLVTTLLSLLTPPFGVPDEPNHGLRAVQVSQGTLVARPSPISNGAAEDTALLQVMYHFEAINASLIQRYPVAHLRPSPRLTLQQLAAVQGTSWSGHTEFIPFLNTIEYPPMFYLPSAMGWRTGQAFHFTILHSLFLARLLASVTAVLLGWLALSLVSPPQRPPVFAFLLLPTALSLNASCSQDGLLLPAAALSVALLQRAMAAGRAGLLALYLALSAALLACCVCARLPYVLLLAALLLPGLVSRVRQRWIWCGALLALALAAALGWGWTVHRLGVNNAYYADPALQSAYIRGHPLAATHAMLHGLLKAAPTLVLTSVAVLGQNDVVPARWISLLLGLCFLPILLTSSGPGFQRRGRWVRASVLLMVAATVAALTLSEYLIWTAPGAGTVEGLQARYLLPLLPLLFFLLPVRDVSATRLARIRTLTLMAYVLLVCTMPAVAAHRFYGTGLLPALRVIAR